MQQTILIPIDGSESVDETILYAHSIAPDTEVHIVLLHVSPDTDPNNASVETLPNMHRLDKSLKNEGYEVKCETRIGDPVREIIKMAILLPATLLLMSTHGRSGIERIREGSVTEQVVQQSPCPIFILHSNRQEPADQRKEHLFKRILVPLDGTDASSAILGCVEQFALRHDSEIVLFHDELEQAESDEDKLLIRTKLQDLSIQLANKDLKVTLNMSMFKRPIREILEKVDEMGIDLVAMATHGDCGKPRAMSESVTAEVVRHSNCPLLVWSADPQCPTVNA